MMFFGENLNKTLTNILKRYIITKAENTPWLSISIHFYREERKNIMKKKFAVIFTMLSILFSGCTRDVSGISSGSSGETSSSQSSEASDSAGEDSQEEEPAPDGDDNDTWQMDEEYRKIEPGFSDSSETLGILGITPGHVYFDKTETESSQIVLDYDLKNDNWQEIGNCRTSTANFSALTEYIQIDNKIYFNQDDYLVCVDPAGQEITYPLTFDFLPTVVSIEGANEQEFYILLLDADPVAEKWEYHVLLFNVKDNSAREIITETESTIQDIGTRDGLLYLYCIEDGDGGRTQKIKVCNSDGEFQQEIPLDDLQSRLKQEGLSIETFDVLGDCFFFKPLGSGSQFLYAYEDGELQLLDLPSDSSTLDYQKGDRKQNPYYYFWDSSARTLYPFHCETKTFSRLEINAGEDKDISIRDDVEGDLTISCHKWEEKTTDFYYIPQSTILKYME